MSFFRTDVLAQESVPVARLIFFTVAKLLRVWRALRVKSVCPLFLEQEGGGSVALGCVRGVSLRAIRRLGGHLLTPSDIQSFRPPLTHATPIPTLESLLNDPKTLGGHSVRTFVLGSITGD